MKTSHRYRRACEVLIRVKLNVLEKLVLPVVTMIPMSASASVTGMGAIPLICTSQSISGVMTSLSGPATMQVMVKLLPAVGIPGIETSILNRLASSAVDRKKFITQTCINEQFLSNVCTEKY